MYIGVEMTDDIDRDMWSHCENKQCDSKPKQRRTPFNRAIITLLYPIILMIHIPLISVLVQCLRQVQSDLILDRKLFLFIQ